MRSGRRANSSPTGMEHRRVPWVICGIAGVILMITAGACGHHQDTTAKSSPTRGESSSGATSAKGDSARQALAETTGSQSAVAHGVGNRGLREANPADAVDESKGSGLLTITLTGSAVLSITDPRERHMRYDPEEEDYVSNIPYSLADRGTIWDMQDSTASTPRSDRIEIPDAIDGSYRIEVIGQAEGEFWLGISDYDAEGGLTGWEDVGETAPGSHTVYVVRYSSRPGVPIQVREIAADSLQHR